MRILQFTDPHIAPHGADTFGVDVRANFTAILKRIKEVKPDHVVLSGDLCFRDAQRDIYEWIRQTLIEADINPYIIPGNHDDNTILAEVFELELTDGELFYNVGIGDVNCLFLDTGPAVMSDNQYAWLKEQLGSGQRSMIFMHHPPVECGTPFMDKNHAFRQMDLFADAVRGFKGPLHIFCGHYHCDRVIDHGNLSVAITPSTFFQINGDLDEFGIDHYRVGYRMIEIVSGAIRHWVQYLEN